MARMSAYEKVKRANGLCTRAVTLRRSQGYDGLWEEMRRLYMGDHFGDALSELDRVVINIAKSIVDVIVPSVTLQNPKFTVEAKRSHEEDQAVIAEKVLNYFWSTRGFRQPTAMAAMDGLVYGLGWAKVRWETIEGPVEMTESEVENEIAGRVAAVDLDPTDNFGDPEQEALKMSPYKKGKVTEGPIVDRVSPFDIYVDPYATCMSDVRWIAHRIRRDLDEVHEDRAYKAGPRKKVVASGRPANADEREPHDFGADTNLATLWEFWDIAKSEWFLFAEGVDEPLIAPRGVPYTFLHPFVPYMNYVVPDRFYPMGEIESIRGLQDELNLTRTQMAESRAFLVPRNMYHPEAFTPDGVEALETGRIGGMIPVKDGYEFDQAMAPLQAANIPSQLFDMTQVIQGDIVQVTGVSEYSRGMAPKSQRTATEASLIQESQSSRAAMKLDGFERFVSEVGKRVLMMCQQFLTDETEVRITGEQGSVWFDFTPDDIAGEFDFGVVAGSTRPRNDMQTRQDWLQLMQVMGPMLVPGGPINVPAFLAKVLETFDVKDVEKYVLPPAPPMPPGMEGGPMPQMPGQSAPGGTPANLPMPSPQEDAQAGVAPELGQMMRGQTAA
jgi:hypothetical protein